MSAKLRVLIVDDEEAARYGMRRALAALDVELIEAADAPGARQAVARSRPDVVLLDVNLPDTNGLALLNEWQAAGEEALVIIVTAYGSERMAVEAIKSGAYDYLAKPFDVDELRLVVRNALETVRLRRENEALRHSLALAGATAKLLGQSAAMEKVRAMIDKVAETDATVLIRGESGTGKELVARAIHERSRRRGRFVAVNCAALPSELIESELFGHEKGAFTGATMRRQGKFEQASGGTLFLDEIGDMSVAVQAKLLRALEERNIERLGGTEPIAVDVRIVSATHRDLEREIETGNFRADLFFRLRVVTIEIPPLRQRREDIPLLATAFAEHAAQRYGITLRPFSSAALRSLIEHNWPGNVRELRNAVERAVIMAEGREITTRDLALEQTAARAEGPKDENDATSLRVPFTMNFRADRRAFERAYIARCLESTDGNVTRAARLLGMHRQSLQHKLRELGLARRYVPAEETDTA